MATYGASAIVSRDVVLATVWRDHRPIATARFTAGDVEVGKVADWCAWVTETDAAPAEELHP